MPTIINTPVNATMTETMSNVSLANALMANVPEVCGIYYKDLPTAMLQVHPRIQRDLADHYRKIAEEWDITKCQPLTVSWKEDGTFLIIDGQHRYMAAKLKNVEMLPCRVFKNLTEEEEAKLFYQQNDNNRRLRPRDMLRAKLTVGETGATILKELCDKHGVFLFKTGEFDIPFLKDVSGMEHIISTWGAAVAEAIFQFIELAGWHTDLNAYSSYTIRPVMTLWRKLYIKSGHEDPTEDVLDVAEVINGMPLEQFVSAAKAMSPHCTEHMAIYELMHKVHDGKFDLSALAEKAKEEIPENKNTKTA